jgi:hypothetical protein
VNIEKGIILCYGNYMNISRRDGMPSNDHIPAFKRTIIKAALLSILFIVPGVALAEKKEKIQLGVVENVMLLPWGVTLPARIDTGAAISSLDARNLTIKGNMVEFTLPEQYGGQHIRLPIVKWMTVKSAETKEKRPVVLVDLCIGPKRMQTEVNLNNRSNVKHPLLIGRNTLMHGFVVACDTSFCTQPSCPEVTPK